MAKKKSTIEIRAYENPHSANSQAQFMALTPADATGIIYWYVDLAYVTQTRGQNGVTPLNYMNISPAGDHLVTAVYVGDINYLPSSAVIVQTAI